MKEMTKMKSQIFKIKFVFKINIQNEFLFNFVLQQKNISKHLF